MKCKDHWSFLKMKPQLFGHILLKEKKKKSKPKNCTSKPWSKACFEAVSAKLFLTDLK